MKLNLHLWYRSSDDQTQFYLDFCSIFIIYSGIIELSNIIEKLFGELQSVVWHCMICVVSHGGLWNYLELTKVNEKSSIFLPTKTIQQQYNAVYLYSPFFSFQRFLLKVEDDFQVIRKWSNWTDNWDFLHQNWRGFKQQDSFWWAINHSIKYICTKDLFHLNTFYFIIPHQRTQKTYT